jgi:hypothetical protein
MYSNTKAFNLLAKTFPSSAIEEHRTTYSRCVFMIEKLLAYTGEYVRPERSRKPHPFVQTTFPEIRRDKFEEGVVLSKPEFARQAIQRESPLVTQDAESAARLDPDLVAALDYVALRGEHIAHDRKERMARLRLIAAKLEPLRHELDRLKSTCSRLIAADFNIAWTAAVIDAMRWPDVELPMRFATGFPVVFDIPDSGVFRASEQPASITPQSFLDGNVQMVDRIAASTAARVNDTDPQAVERTEACWTRTKEEIREGLIFGPFTRSQLDTTFGRGEWRCMGRSAIWQKGKWRCIDDGRRNKANAATSMHERITCGRADFPATIAREIAKRVKRHAGQRVRMKHGTDDVRAAYRKVPTSQPEYTCVAVWNTDAERVVYCIVPGHNFGLTSAVANYCRSPELVMCAARRLAWVLNEHYVDDHDICEPESAGDSGQLCLWELCSERFFGYPFDKGKHEPMAEENEYLGVITDFSHTATRRVVRMDVSKKRRAKLRELVREVYRAKTLRSGLASSIFGKARFTMSPCFGSIGKACLQPIMQREYEPRKTELTDELVDSLQFIDMLTTHLPATELPLLASTSPDKVVVFTDAEGTQRKRHRHGKPPTGHLGFVVIHPVHGTVRAKSKVPARIVELLDRIKERDSYINQFELIAAITPFISLPRDWFEGRPIELWVDNSAAIGGLVKGYSGTPDCARIINMFHFAIASLGAASLYIDYVPSESNIADIPSREHAMSSDEVERLDQEIGPLVAMHIPEFATRDGKWLSYNAIARSMWHT